MVLHGDTFSWLLLVLWIDFLYRFHIKGIYSNPYDFVIRIVENEQRLRLCRALTLNKEHMMTSSNGNIFGVTGPLGGEFTGHGEFPWGFLWSALEQTAE